MKQLKYIIVNKYTGETESSLFVDPDGNICEDRESDRFICNKDDYEIRLVSNVCDKNGKAVCEWHTIVNTENWLRRIVERDDDKQALYLPVSLLDLSYLQS